MFLIFFLTSARNALKILKYYSNTRQAFEKTRLVYNWISLCSYAALEGISDLSRLNR
jgi:hypothetical protein